MDPATLGARLASAALTPLLRKILVQEGSGAGLADPPVRLSGRVSLRGEKRTLTDADTRRLARAHVTAAVRGPGKAPFPADETEAVVLTLAATLHAAGDLTMDDVQAARLDPAALARTLRRAAPAPDGLSADAVHFLGAATEGACRHVLHFFSQRSTFVPRTLVEQRRDHDELSRKTDELLSRTPPTGSADAAFEDRYLRHVAERHRHLTIYGIDLRDSPERWPLEVAYLSLEATATADQVVDPLDHLDHAAPPSGPVRLRAEDAFEGGHDRVLLRGEAGSGKTTLVQWLAVTAAGAGGTVGEGGDGRTGGRIPFVLPLRTLVRDGSLPGPGDFLRAVSCPLTAPDGWAERVLSDSRALILVDGLDEIPTAERHRVRDWLLGLTDAFPGNRWLLTSRPTAVRPAWLADSGFREVHLPPMRPADVATFVRRWHAAAQADAYEEPLLDSLRTKRDLARLATNPLMCGLICALHRERRGYLPTGRKELYDAALSMLLTRRDRERGMSGVDLDEAAQLELLQHLAYALVLGGRTEMSRAGAESLLERRLPAVASAAALGDAPAVLRTLLLRSGLLREPAEGAVDFVHRTFQDYLAARHAVDEGHALPFVQRLADDPQGEDAIRMAVAHARPGERATLLRELLSGGTPRLTLLALACLEHATALDPAVRAEVEEQAAALIPPRTPDDAKALAEAGPLVLELLPGPEGLSEAEAHGVAVTASLLGEAEPVGALGVLRRLREHPSLDVRRQLVGTWRRFDADEYAREVLDHLDREGLILNCHSTEQYPALRAMRPWHDVVFRGRHVLGDLAGAVPDPAAVTYLSLEDNPLADDLEPLTAFPALSSIWLGGCEYVDDFGTLAALPLTRLGISLCGGTDGLTRLRSLRRISLYDRLPGASLTDSLPVEAPLEFLFLGRKAIDGTGLRGLHHWPTLTTLSLGPLSTAPTAHDWRYVAELPALRTLYLNRVLLSDFADSVAALPDLPRVEELRLASLRGTEDVGVLPSRLPGVRRVTLQTYPGATVPTAPYARLFPHAEIAVDQR
ncbi:NACHT domain-containing protein [Streptomyces beihaiensis]|uniref:NACHT domain-containing protein n=1 Tax=Streptomyces beihaiensis TaxID=2984495 RepID=A0ABT3TN04_9ACTN|nr:NACHT domain-containing protein [Streptomyces beihaiensis]MCX3058430.1 NACHT domain-containing protein [Streptomyces beihaiensis]